MYDAGQRLELAEELAEVSLAGCWKVEDLAERAGGCLDRRPRWLGALAFAAVAMERVAPSRRVPLVLWLCPATGVAD